MPREWDATSYDTLPLPHTQWGIRTVERLDPDPAWTVLDAGCGTGRDAELLLDRLPDGRVVAVDGSANMLERLRERITDRSRVDVVQADLADPAGIPVAGPVDAVTSVAAFHWIHDHETLFANLAAVMRPNGRLVTDCGGLGNIRHVNAVIEEVLATPQPSPWNFAGEEETAERLQQAGFRDVDVRLRDDPARFDSGDRLRAYLRTVVLGGQLDRLAPQERDDFVEDVASRLTEPVVDYVRLEIWAVRA